MDRAHTKGRDRPILFSAPMVRALLEGRKTQTRRVLKPAPEQMPGGGWHVPWQVGGGSIMAPSSTGEEIGAEAAEGLRIRPGDRLWVREPHHRTNDHHDSHLVGYDAADGPVPREDRHHIEGVGNVQFFRHSLGGWGGRMSRNYPGIHMPRWASRLTLTVTDVRVQRLQDISGNDAQAEGISIGGPDVDVYRREAERNHEAARRWNAYRIRQYRDVWEAINGAGSWEANPWIAAYTFTVETRSINEGLGQRADATQSNPESPSQSLEG